jgi:hypothetical protein
MLAVAFIACTATAWAQPKLTILGLNGADMYDWGTVNATAAPLETTLEIRNDGDQELVISGVKPGCGCTTPALGKSSLNPGEKTTLKIGLNTGGRPQSMYKSLNITSNDPAMGSKYIFLKAEVIKELDVQPPYLVFPAQMTIGKKEKATVKITNNSKQDITLTNFAATNDASLSVKGKQVLKAGSTLDVEVSVTPKAAGVYQTQITASTTHPDFPTLSITGAGNVAAEGASK